MMDGRQNWTSFEDGVKPLLEKYFQTFLQKEIVDIDGKGKKFDFVNRNNKVVGDAKFYSFTSSGHRPSAKFSTLNEYIWLLQKISSSWKKFLVIGDDESLVEKYVNEFEPWIKGVSIFFSDGKSVLKEIRKE